MSGGIDVDLSALDTIAGALEGAAEGLEGLAGSVEPGSPAARATTLVTLLLLGGWAAVAAVVGAVEESWLWGVLLGAAAVYLFWAAARIWRRAPRSAAARR